MAGEVTPCHIQQHISEDNQQFLIKLIHQMRSAIVGNPGDVSGEMLKRIDQPVKAGLR